MLAGNCARYSQAWAWLGRQAGLLSLRPGVGILVIFIESSIILLYKCKVLHRCETLQVNTKGGNYRLRAIAGTMVSSNNLFYNCTKAISATSYFEVIAEYCDIRSTQTTTSLGIPNHLGEYGILIKTNRWRLIDISKNKLYNVENGIVFNAEKGVYDVGTSTSSGNGQYSGQVTVNSNTITGYTDQYVANAIILRNVNRSVINYLPSTNVTANFNNISGVYRGIYSTNWLNKNVLHNNNTIKMVNETVTTMPVQFGISEENNVGNEVFLYGNEIKENNIEGPGINSNINFNSIYTSGCGNQLVKCNTVKKTTMGIQFAGFNPGTRFFANTMSNHKYGYVLSNTGFIGHQGAIGAPSDNKWVGTWAPFVNYKTATLSSSTSQDSKLFVRTGVPYMDYNPNGSGYTSIPLLYYGTFIGSLITTTSTTSPNVNCLTVQISGGGINTDIHLLKKIVTDSIHCTGPDSLKTICIAKNKIYRMLKDNPTLLDSSVVLYDFYMQNMSTVKETYINIEDTMAKGYFTSGQALCNTLVPVNNIEENYKTFFDIYLKHKTTILLATDSVKLIAMAELCPFTDGDVIYQARALYNIMYNKNIFFKDLCPQNIERRSMEINLPMANEFDVMVYPNPNNGEVFLLPTIANLNSLGIKLFDINGKEVYNANLQPTDGLFSLTLSIADGTYLLYISSKTGDYVTKRIIIKK